MPSKPKSKLYSVAQRGRAYHGGFTVLKRFIVSARNEKEACEVMATITGKHAKLEAFLVKNPEVQLKYKHLTHGKYEQSYSLKAPKHY